MKRYKHVKVRVREVLFFLVRVPGL